MPKSTLQIFLQLCQVWCWDHSPRKPLPVPNHSLGEEDLPNIHPKHPFTQLQAIPLGSVTGDKRENISACLSNSLHEEAVTKMRYTLILLFFRLQKPYDLSPSSSHVFLYNHFVYIFKYKKLKLILISHYYSTIFSARYNDLDLDSISYFNSNSSAVYRC